MKHSQFQSLLLAVAFLLSFTAAAQAAHPGAFRVFILHSYESNHVCGQPQHDGMIAALADKGLIEGRDLTIAMFHMDTKKTNNTPALIEKAAAAAIPIIERFDPQVLVTLDDNAFKSVAARFLDRKMAIVFSGLNGQPEAYHRKFPFLDSREKPGHNITGVHEKLHIAVALKVHSRMFPDTGKVLCLTDQSTTGKAIHRQIGLELAAEPPSLGWELTKVSSWEEYQAQIHAANQDPTVGAIYPAALLLKDRKMKTYTAPEIFQWTTQISKKPEIAVNYAFARLGLFGGATVDFYAMGRQAGEMVARILAGEKAGDIPIQEAERFALAFNIKRAAQLGIEIPTEILLAADEVIHE